MATEVPQSITKRKRPSYLHNFPPLDEFGTITSGRFGSTDEQTVAMTHILSHLDPELPSAENDTQTLQSQNIEQQAAPSSDAAYQSSSSQLVRDRSPRLRSKRCRRCVHRKRGCDRVRPRCSLCIKQNADCVYGGKDMET